MAPVVDTVCKIVQKVYGYFGPTLGIENIDGIFKGLYSRYKKQVDSKSSREAVRLMQLGFLGSFRYDSGTSTQHFEMLDTVDIGIVEMLKCRRFVQDGVTQTMYDERVDTLKQQLVDARGQNLS